MQLNVLVKAATWAISKLVRYLKKNRKENKKLI